MLCMPIGYNEKHQYAIAKQHVIYISTFRDYNIIFFVFTGLAERVGNFIMVETEH